MSWNNRSYFSGQSGNRQYSSSSDEYGGGQHEGIGGKKRPSSRLKKSGGKKADADYPGYTTDGGYNDNYNNNYSSYGNGGYGSSPYNNGYGSSTPYYGGRGGGGYNNSNSSYSNDGGGYTGGAGVRPYNAPAATWAPQDGTPSPMFINTKEVNVYAVPGSQYDNGYNNDQRRRGGGGFFRPAFEAVGHFFDRRFGFNDRD